MPLTLMEEGQVEAVSLCNLYVLCGSGMWERGDYKSSHDRVPLVRYLDLTVGSFGPVCPVYYWILL